MNYRVEVNSSESEKAYFTKQNMSLKEFLQNKPLEKNLLEIQVIKMITLDKFIVGDSSGLALLDITENPSHAKDIKIGTAIKLLKPILINTQSLKTNKNFRPLKSKKIIDLDISNSDLEKFDTMQGADDTKISNKLTSFATIRALKNQTITNRITAIVGHVSRIIEISKGKYQIAGLVDINNDKLSINLYDSNINKMEPANIYTLTKVKIATIIKDGQLEKRLFSTKLTTISEASDDDKAEFETVSLGNIQVIGTIIGFSDITSYSKCAVHWNKLSEENICVKCESEASDIKLDFTLELYLQDSENDEILTFRIFKRQIEMIIHNPDEESLEQKLEELDGEKCKVEYDETTDDSNIIPKRLQLQI